MNEELMQEGNSELSTEEAKAALGLSTRLSEQMLVAQAPKEEMVEEEVVETEGVEETPEEPKVEEEKFDAESFKKEIMEEVKKEIGGIKEAIADALNEE